MTDSLTQHGFCGSNDALDCRAIKAYSNMARPDSGTEKELTYIDVTNAGNNPLVHKYILDRSSGHLSLTPQIV
jgi:hypothetical protein